MTFPEQKLSHRPNSAFNNPMAIPMETAAVEVTMEKSFAPQLDTVATSQQKTESLATRRGKTLDSPSLSLVKGHHQQQNSDARGRSRTVSPFAASSPLSVGCLSSEEPVASLIYSADALQRREIGALQYRLKHGGSPTMFSDRAAKKISRHPSNESFEREGQTDDLANGVPAQPSTEVGHFSASLELLNRIYGHRPSRSAFAMSESGFTATDSIYTDVSTQPSHATSDTHWENQSWQGSINEEGLALRKRESSDRRSRLEELRRRRQLECTGRRKGEIMRHRSLIYPSRRQRDKRTASAVDVRLWTEGVEESCKSEKRHSFPKACQDFTAMLLDDNVASPGLSPILPGSRGTSPSPKPIRRMRVAQDLRTDEADWGHMIMAKISEAEDEDGEDNDEDDSDELATLPTSLTQLMAVRSRPRVKRSRGSENSKKRHTSTPPRSATRSPTLMADESDGNTSMEYDWFSCSQSDDLPQIWPNDPFAPLLDLAVNELMKHYESWRGHQEGEGREQTSPPKRRRGPGKDKGSSKKRSQVDQESPMTEDESDVLARTVKRRRSIAQNSRKLACPFWKRDQDAHRDCYKKVLSAIKYVKSHLYKFHETPIFCPICGESFRDESQRDSHIRAQSCQTREFTTFEGMSRTQRLLIQRRADPRLSDEENWFRIWDVLFPGVARPPSAYIDNELSEDLCSFREFFTYQGADILRNYLSTSDPMYPQSEQRLLHQRMVLSRGLELIYEGWIDENRGGTPENTPLEPHPPQTSESLISGESGTRDSGNASGLERGVGSPTTSDEYVAVPSGGDYSDRDLETAGTGSGTYYELPSAILNIDEFLNDDLLGQGWEYDTDDGGLGGTHSWRS